MGDVPPAHLPPELTMFPSQDLSFSSVSEFVRSLTGDQRRFYLALEQDREERLQSTLRAAAASLSGLSALLTESVHVRLDTISDQSSIAPKILGAEADESPLQEDDDLEEEEQDLGEIILEDGKEVAYQDWDSGGPGAGAGRVSVFEYEGLFYVFHDAGMEGGYATIDEAMDKNGVVTVNNATVSIWRKDQGYIFLRRPS